MSGSDDCRSFLAACRGGNVRKVEQLLEKETSADLLQCETDDKFKNKGLALAVLNKQVDIIEVLLNRGADLNITADNKPLLLVANDECRALLKKIGPKWRDYLPSATQIQLLILSWTVAYACLMYVYSHVGNNNVKGNTGACVFFPGLKKKKQLKKKKKQEHFCCSY